MNHDELSASNHLPAAERDAIVRAITRPEPALLKFYALSSLFAGPFFPIVFIPLFFRYTTMRYTFGDDGISVSWGILFRRENHLTYPRIQDIHVTRNFVERWFGIAKVSVQTASGAGSAEAAFVGVSAYEEIRDFLYSRMRGLDSDDAAVPDAAGAEDEPVVLLTEIRDALRRLNEQLGSTDTPAQDLPPDPRPAPGQNDEAAS